MYHQHICCDRSKFVTVEPSSNKTITGVAGEVPVLGHGRVKIGNISLFNVAYVPSMHFNLIPIKRASSVSDCRFVFDNSSVYAIFKSGEVKRFGSTKNGLYVLDRPSMLKVPGKELSFTGSELTIDSSVPIYDPLSLRPKAKASAGQALRLLPYAQTVDVSL